MTTSIFDAIRGRVTALDAAQQYGITVRRGMARCPFHGDRTPSMKLDARFHCFGCQADGDAVDFTARLFGLTPINAAKKLAADFGVSYDAGYTPPPKPTKPVINKHDTIQRYVVLLRSWKSRYAPKSPDDPWHPLFVEALENLSRFESDEPDISEDELQRIHRRVVALSGDII